MRIVYPSYRQHWLYGLKSSFKDHANHLQALKGFSGSSDSKESSFNAGDLGSIPGLGRSPGGGHGNPLQYSWLENPHGQSLKGYSPWGCKESDMTERLSTRTKRPYMNNAKKYRRTVEWERLVITSIKWRCEGKI